LPPAEQNGSLPILESLEYQSYEGNTWGYQGGYQPTGAYNQQQQQQQQQPAAGNWAGAPQQGDTFDLNAYQAQQQGGYVDEQQQQQPNGYQY
jgi:hypothetical protein